MIKRILMLLVVAAVAVSSNAAVLLTGGDAGDGLTLDASKVVAAYNFSSWNGALTVQGVTFADHINFPWAGVTTMVPDAWSAGAELFGVGSGAVLATNNTSNDIAIKAIANSLLYGDGSAWVEFRGLTPGLTYKFDIITSLAGYPGPRTQDIWVADYESAPVVVRETFEATVNGVYNTTFTRQADADGTLFVGTQEASSGAYVQGGWVNAAVVSLVDPVATDPIPANGAVEIDTDQILRWNTGGPVPANVDKHYVYFGTDFDIVANATKGDPSHVASLPVGTRQYGPALNLDTTYYWRVDEVVNPDTNPNNIQKGMVWSLDTTQGIVCAINPEGDVSEDCLVDLADIAKIGQEWLSTYTMPDLLLSVGNWLDNNWKEPGERWTAQRAQDWYDAAGPIVGVNYIPRTATNTTEMWQASTFDLTTIAQELSWAKQYGFNSVRVFLPYIVYESDRQGFLERFEQFLQIADARDISTMVVFFDDCMFGYPPNDEPYLGFQGNPLPGEYAPYWTPSPGTTRKQESYRAALKQYVTDIMDRHSDDPRILMWDLFNEPTNGGYGNSSLPLVRDVFKWARQIDPTQPITSGQWHNNTELNEILYSNSDIITFHDYGSAANLTLHVDLLENIGRPMMCTEIISRDLGSNYDTALPVLANHKIGWYNWGLVNGRTQTHYGWDSQPYDPEPVVWHHDLLHPDGTPYDPTEINLILNFPTMYNAAP